jgi:hypothetical protein
MDAEALKIILDLQKENILLKRAINDAEVTLIKQKPHLVLQYGLEETNRLFSAIYDTLEKFDQMKKRLND